MTSKEGTGTTVELLKGVEAKNAGQRMLRAALISAELHNSKPDQLVKARQDYLFGAAAQSQFTSDPKQIISHPKPAPPNMTTVPKPNERKKRRRRRTRSRRK